MQSGALKLESLKAAANAANSRLQALQGKQQANQALLESARDDALLEFGTSDPAALLAMAKKLEEEEAAAWAEYEAKLRALEFELAKIEAALG